MAAQEFMPRDEVVGGIRADIEQYEAERQKAFRDVLWRIPVFFGALLVLVAILAYAFNSFASPYEQWTSSPHVILYVLSLIAVYPVYLAAVRPASRLKRSFRERLLPIIFGFVEELHHANGKRPDSFDRLPRPATGSFDEGSFDDVVSGKYEGFPFELYETSLSVESGNSKTTVFKGIVVAFGCVAPFPGLLVAARKTGRGWSFSGDVPGAAPLEAVASGLADLDAAYEFQTDNADAGRVLVEGKLGKVLQWVNATWPGEPPRVALHGRDGFLLLPLDKELFELPAISSPLDYKAHIEPMVADLVTLLATASLVRRAGAPDAEPAETPQS